MRQVRLCLFPQLHPFICRCPTCFQPCFHHQTLTFCPSLLPGRPQQETPFRAEGDLGGGVAEGETERLLCFWALRRNPTLTWMFCFLLTPSAQTRAISRDGTSAALFPTTALRGVPVFFAVRGSNGCTDQNLSLENDRDIENQ